MTAHLETRPEYSDMYDITKLHKLEIVKIAMENSWNKDRIIDILQLLSYLNAGFRI